MLTLKFQKYLEDLLSRVSGKKLHLHRIEPLAGGSINQSCKVVTSYGNFFLKTNDAFNFPGMFEKEKNGLEALRKTSTVAIPQFLACGTFDENAYLILEYIERQQPTIIFNKSFAEKLAALHKVSNDFFGFNEDNYMGSLVQSNKRQSSYAEFFRSERLEPQIQLANKSKKLDEQTLDGFERLFLKLDNLISEESPSLVHGDLWNGNIIPGKNSSAYLIDPAVHYGHREADLAMTKLFGGFDDDFYSCYNEAFPLQTGFNDRVDLYNLYPLLVHVNLFGGSYVSDVKRIVRRFS